MSGIQTRYDILTIGFAFSLISVNSLLRADRKGFTTPPEWNNKNKQKSFVFTFNVQEKYIHGLM